MKKGIIIIFILIACVKSIAQNKTLINPPTGNKNTITHFADGLGIDSALALPSRCGTPDTAYFHKYSRAYRHGYIIADTCNGIVYWYNPFTDSVMTIGSGGGGGSTLFALAGTNNAVGNVVGNVNNHNLTISNADTLKLGAIIYNLLTTPQTYSFGGYNILGYNQLTGNIELVPGSSVTASNGLTLVGTDVQLGGTLTKNTSIQTSTFGLTVQSNASAIPLQTSSQNNIGFGATTLTGQFAAGFYTLPGVDDTTTTVVRLTNSGNAIGANGIGASLDFANATTTSAEQLSNRLISSWSTATDASRTSQFSITGFNNASQSTLFTLNGTGEILLDKYGVGSFTTGTPAYQLAVTADHKLIETSVAAATVRLDSVTLDFDGYHADTTFSLTQSGFKNLEIQAEQEQAGGFQQDFNDTQGTLKWQVAIKGSYKFYITYYY